MADEFGRLSSDGLPTSGRRGKNWLRAAYGGPLHGRRGSAADFSEAAGGLMEKWILAWPLWKRGSARGKPCTQKRVTAAVSHRPLPFPTAAKQSRAPLSHRPCCESFYLQQPFLFLTQPDISLAKKSGHFHLLITTKTCLLLLIHDMSA